MAQRKQSDSVKKMKLIIAALSVALIAAVIALTWFTLSREAENGDIQWRVTSTTKADEKVAGEPGETTTAPAGGTTAADSQSVTYADGLPYDKLGSDRYATWDGKYPSAEVIVKKGEDGKWGSFVADKKVNATGVYCNEYGWWFVRDGYVDYDYTGIAGNDKGKWYVEKGKCNFHYNNTFTAHDSGKYYTVTEGQVPEFAN